MAASDTALYNQIDGAAPKYLDRGWVGSVYASYHHGTDSDRVYVVIHDMGNPDNAQSLFNFELPISRVQISGLSNAIVDTGLPNAYAATALAGRYVIDVSIDERADAALAYVQSFTLATLERCE